MKGGQKDTVSNNPNVFDSMDIKAGSKTACNESKVSQTYNGRKVWGDT